MSKKSDYANRLLKIASEQVKHKHPNSSKQEQLVYQLGFIVGMLSKYAPDDISIHRDIKHHEERLGIMFKE